MLALRRKGFIPDFVVGHGGWGETLFARDVWPNVRILLHAEFFYFAHGADAGFNPEFAGTRPDLFSLQIRARNAPYALALSDADRGVAPTEWQKSRFPPALCRKIMVARASTPTWCGPGQVPWCG